MHVSIREGAQLVGTSRRHADAGLFSEGGEAGNTGRLVGVGRVFCMAILVMVLLLGVNVGSSISAPIGATLPGDTNGDGKVVISEVQQSISSFLGLSDAVSAKLTISEVQQTINSFLGLYDPVAGRLTISFAKASNYTWVVQGADFTFVLPAGVTLQTDAQGNPVVTMSDPSANTPSVTVSSGNVHIIAINLNGFLPGPGVLLTVNYQLSFGAAAVTASDFKLSAGDFTVSIPGTTKSDPTAGSLSLQLL